MNSNNIATAAPVAPAIVAYCTFTLDDERPPARWPAAATEAEALDNALTGMRAECAECGDEPEDTEVFLRYTTLAGLSAAASALYAERWLCGVRPWPASPRLLLVSPEERAVYDAWAHG